jgi:DNA-binding transcriptional regulator YdaS (Cro superfamily)
MSGKTKRPKRKKQLRVWRRPGELDPGLRLAVEAAGGTMAHLARLLDISPQAIAQWREIPLDRVMEVEKATGVDRERLRPDLFRLRRGYRQASARP